MHYNQLKPFNGACNHGQGWIAVETGPTEVLRPSSTKPGSEAEVIVLEDDVFPGAVEPF